MKFVEGKNKLGQRYSNWRVVVVGKESRVKKLESKTNIIGNI